MGIRGKYAATCKRKGNVKKNSHRNKIKRMQGKM